MSFDHTYFFKNNKPLCQILVVAYIVTLTDMCYLCFSYCSFVGQPDVDMCMFTIQLCKHMTSQFDDWLIIGCSKTMTSLKKFEFHNPIQK